MKFGIFGGAVASQMKAASYGGDTGSADAGYSADSTGHLAFIDFVTHAERLGFHSIFVVEHHFTGLEQMSPLALLSYLAAKTSRIRLGTAVTVLPWHNPIVLCEQAATLDVLSNGRFDFGVGKGYRKGEFEGFGVPLDEATERFDEAMEVIHKAWAAYAPFSHTGKYWTYDNARAEPRPVQTPHPPLWQGAGSEASIRHAARSGYNLLLDQLGSIGQTIERVAIFRDECERVGRPYDPMSVGVTRGLYMAATNEERRAAIQDRRMAYRVIGDIARGREAERFKHVDAMTDADIEADDSALLGTPDEIVGRLQRLKEGGVDYVLVTQRGLWGPKTAQFAEKVMSRLADPTQLRTAVA